MARWAKTTVPECSLITRIIHQPWIVWKEIHVPSLDLITTELSLERYWPGLRSQKVCMSVCVWGGGEGTIPNATVSLAEWVCMKKGSGVTVTSVSHWNQCLTCGWQKSINHTSWKEWRTEVESNWGHFAYQPNALPPGQTGFHICNAYSFRGVDKLFFFFFCTGQQGL